MERGGGVSALISVQQRIVLLLQRKDERKEGRKHKDNNDFSGGRPKTDKNGS